MISYNFIMITYKIQINIYNIVNKLIKLIISKKKTINIYIYLKKYSSINFNNSNQIIPNATIK